MNNVLSFKSLIRTVKNLFAIGGVFGLTATPLVAFAQTNYQLLAPIPLGTSGGGLTNTLTGETIGTVSTSATATQYIQNGFLLAVALAGLFAVVRIVWAGITLMSTDAVSGRSEGKAIIQDAVLGFLLAIGAWAILFTIDERLVSFNLGIGTPTTPYTLESRPTVNPVTFFDEPNPNIVCDQLGWCRTNSVPNVIITGGTPPAITTGGGGTGGVTNPNTGGVTDPGSGPIGGTGGTGGSVDPGSGPIGGTGSTGGSTDPGSGPIGGTGGTGGTDPNLGPINPGSGTTCPDPGPSEVVLVSSFQINNRIHPIGAAFKYSCPNLAFQTTGVSSNDHAIVTSISSVNNVQGLWRLVRFEGESQNVWILEKTGSATLYVLSPTIISGSGGTAPDPGTGPVGTTGGSSLPTFSSGDKVSIQGCACATCGVIIKTNLTDVGGAATLPVGSPGTILPPPEGMVNPAITAGGLWWYGMFTHLTAPIGSGTFIGWVPASQEDRACIISS